LALVGPSGCGKTTLARMIVGLDTATSGEMRFEGTEYRGADLPAVRRADLSLVFQDPFGSFNPRLTIAQSLGEPLRLVPKLGPMEHEQRLVDAIDSVGLDRTMLSRYPHEFSGGQRQRLAIARALVTRPKLVVLDEPVSALDVSVRGDVLDLLAKLQNQFGLTYLIISHDLDMVAAMADRVLVMEAGKIVEEGEPKTLFDDPKHRLTRALMAARLPDIV
ncbi:MAG: ATP-binding cassette domain-containing protein, partial [Hyphomicrobiales bacterium]